MPHVINIAFFCLKTPPSPSNTPDLHYTSQQLLPSTMSTTTFIDSITNLPLLPTTLKPYTSRASFPEFYSSAFPIFCLHPSISASDLTSAITQINQQACTELTFLPEELAETGVAAALPTLWQLHDRDPSDAVTSFLDEFEEGSADEAADPTW